MLYRLRRNAARSKPAPTHSESGVGLVGSSSFDSSFDRRLQRTVGSHFSHDVATADQLTTDPQLREGWPVGVLWQVGADFRVLQDVHIGKLFATGHDSLSGFRGEPTLWGIRRAFHVK